jgi:hypothetical protein
LRDSRIYFIAPENGPGRLGFGTFVIVTRPDPSTLTTFLEDVARAVRDAGRDADRADVGRPEVVEGHGQ